MRKKTEINVCVFGQDCTPSKPTQLTVRDLRSAAIGLLIGAAAIEAKLHGAIDYKSDGETIVHIGVDRGGAFSETTGLPLLDYQIVQMDPPIIRVYKRKKRK